MELSEKEVRYVADLANLALSDLEIERLRNDLAHILTHIEQLSEVNTDGIEPMAQVLFDADETATLREDIPHTPLTNADALANAAQSGNGYFKVPKVIER